MVSVKANLEEWEKVRVSVKAKENLEEMLKVPA